MKSQMKKTIKCVRDTSGLTKGKTYYIDGEHISGRNLYYFIMDDDGHLRTYYQSEFIPPTELEDIALLMRLEIKNNEIR